MLKKYLRYRQCKFDIVPTSAMSTMLTLRNIGNVDNLKSISYQYHDVDDIEKKYVLDMNGYSNYYVLTRYSIDSVLYRHLFDSVGQAFHILSAGYCSPGQLSCFCHIPRVSRREALPYEHTVFLGHLYIWQGTLERTNCCPHLWIKMLFMEISTTVYKFILIVQDNSKKKM